MESLQGHLLVASPHLPDSNFSKSVVLLVEHSPEGAVGLILNRVANTRLDELWSDANQGDCESDDFVLFGGPVSGPLMSLHGHAECADLEVLPGVYFSSDSDNLRRLVAKNQPPFRMFLGYSGWGPAQLESELKVGGWLVSLGTKQIVFAEDIDDIWQRTIHATGQSILRESLHIDRFPDPSYN
jgi:putative transcriptional regulator